MPRHRFTDTRQRIEEAATRLFVEKGITETRCATSRAQVGISEGALYRHFESKDDLVWQTFERHYTSFARELESLAAREPTASRKSAAMIRGFCRAHDDNPTRFNFLVFVQHGQLRSSSQEAPTPVDRDARGASPAPSSRRDPGAGSGSRHRARARRRAAAGARSRPTAGLPLKLEPVSDRLVAAAWAAVTTL